MSPLQSAKLAAMGMTDLGKDALHVYVGLGVLLLTAALFRLSLRDPRPLAAVLLVALAGEIWDRLDTLDAGGTPHWARNGKDIWNTLFWPAVLFAFARYTAVLRR